MQSLKVYSVATFSISVCKANKPGYVVSSACFTTVCILHIPASTVGGWVTVFGLFVCAVLRVRCPVLSLQYPPPAMNWNLFYLGRKTNNSIVKCSNTLHSATGYIMWRLTGGRGPGKRAPS